MTFIICVLGTNDGQVDDLTLGMCGDVNGFLRPCELEEGQEDLGHLTAEVEVMIADMVYRRRGIAFESLTLLIHWLLQHEPRITLFVAKIADDNEPSMSLFKKLGFRFHRHLDVFGQTELHLAREPALTISSEFWNLIGAQVLGLSDISALKKNE